MSEPMLGFVFPAVGPPGPEPPPVIVPARTYEDGYEKGLMDVADALLRLRSRAAKLTLKEMSRNDVFELLSTAILRLRNRKADE